MLHPIEAESASFDSFLTKNQLTEESESASFDAPARIGLSNQSSLRAPRNTKRKLSNNSAPQCQTVILWHVKKYRKGVQRALDADAVSDRAFTLYLLAAFERLFQFDGFA